MDIEKKTENVPTSLNSFVFKKVINSTDQNNSFICLCSTTFFGTEQNGIVFLKKASFKEKDIPSFFLGNEQENENPIVPAALTKLTQHNGKFFNFIGSCDARLNPLFINVICPASQKDIEKYSAVPYIVVRETPSIFNKITFPYMKTHMSKTELEWVFNILDGKAEQEKVIYDSAKDESSAINSMVVTSRYSIPPDTTTLVDNVGKIPSFILVPDTKWDERVGESLYILGIVRHPIIPCLRCLTPADLPLLREIRFRGPAEIVKKYGVQCNITAERILAYVHYLPSFFQFHVHFVSTARTDFFAPRCYLLDDIIDHLEEDALPRWPLTDTNSAQRDGSESWIGGEGGGVKHGNHSNGGGAAEEDDFTKQKRGRLTDGSSSSPSSSSSSSSQAHNDVVADHTNNFYAHASLSLVLQQTHAIIAQLKNYNQSAAAESASSSSSSSITGGAAVGSAPIAGAGNGVGALVTAGSGTGAGPADSV